MIKGLLKFVAGSLIVMAVVLGLSFISLEAAGAQGAKQAACEGSGGTWTPSPSAQDPQDGICDSGGRSLTSTISQVSSILLYIVGAVSVLMVVIGGLRYALAQGDSNAVNAAKNTVLYALVGVLVASMGLGLVTFVTSQFQ